MAVSFHCQPENAQEILNAFLYEDIVFTLSDGKVDITAGKSKVSLPTSDR